MQTEENKQSLMYKPDIKYDEDYSTNYVGNPDVANNDVPEEPDTTIPDVGDTLDKLENLINGLPNDISNIVNNVFDHIDEIWEDDLKDKDYNPIPPEHDWDYIPEPEPGDDDKDPDGGGDDPGGDDDEDNDDIWDVGDLPSVDEKEVPKDEIVEKEYIKHLTDVIDDYANKLNNVLTEFWTNVLISIFNKAPNDIKFIMNNILLNSKDVKGEKQHLLDLGIKSQLTKSVKMDFYANLFTREETIVHLKQFKVAYELRKRYAKIQEADGETKTGAMDANMLKAMTISADRKYDTAFDNLYKYLNSSVLVLNDVLTTYLQEIKSKQILIEGAGINDNKTNK